jgi:hypothetical protein
MGVELVDLEDYDVPDRKLQCNNNDTDDDNALKSEGMDVSDGSASSLQYLELNFGPLAELVPTAVSVHSEHHLRGLFPSWTCFSMWQERPLI